MNSAVNTLNVDWTALRAEWKKLTTPHWLAESRPYWARLLAHLGRKSDVQRGPEEPMIAQQQELPTARSEGDQKTGRGILVIIMIQVVVGGPPCQAFSSSGKQLSVLDPQGLLVNEFFRIIDEIRPRMFLFENVRGLITARDSMGEPGGVIRGLLDHFWKVGYSCRAALLNSADYGSFQRRVRCFIIGTKHGRAPLFPEPSHHKQGSMFCLPWRSLGGFLENNADPNKPGW